MVVKESQIVNGGKGVYTLEFISAMTVIGEYLGKIIPSGQKVKNTDYTFYISKKTSIDAQNYPRCILAMINDAHGSQFITNCQFKKQGKHVYIVTISDIIADSELFIDYGQQYWKSR